MTTSADYKKMFTRYFQKVKMGPDCWEWIGATSRSGYGRMHVDGRIKRATHVSFLLTNHRWPHPHLQLNHTCDNKPCVRPSHIYEGTKKQNSADAIERGQLARGMNNGQAKLTPRKVQLARTLWRLRGNTRKGGKLPGTVTQTELADMCGVCQQSLFRVLHRKTWKQVGPSGWEKASC